MRRAWLYLAWFLIAVTFIAGCGAEPTDQSANLPADPQRIVSLSPALSRLLVDMGEGGRLVGVAQHDSAVPGLPACGNYLDPDVERILALAPDLVLTESGSQPLPARLAELQQAGVFRVVAVPELRSIADVGRALTHPTYGMGVTLGAEETATRTAERMTRQVESITAAIAAEPRPRVLMLMGTAPMGAIGPGVTHDELLTLAGGDNVLAEAGAGYVVVDRQMLIEDLRPDVILLIMPGAAPLAEGDARLQPLNGLPIPAIEAGRVVLINHPQALLPSSSLPEVLAAIAAALHPEAAQQVRDALTAGVTP